jgi:hypothetical protein
MYLDRRPDWKEVADRLREAYRLAAPKKLLAQLNASETDRDCR